MSASVKEVDLSYDCVVLPGNTLNSAKQIEVFKMEHQTEDMAEGETNDIKENLKKKLMKSAVLDSFTKLTSAVDKVRVDAGLNLIKHLSSPGNTEVSFSAHVLICDIYL